MIYYLAYGSNLNLRQMRSRCPDSRVVGWARLPGFRLVYRGSKTGSFLSIEPGEWPDPDGLMVGIFEVPRLDELALDCYEGYPAFYQKYRVTLDKVYAFGGLPRCEAEPSGCVLRPAHRPCTGASQSALRGRLH